jgi:alkyldihydroxyacetonephosphate synthase
MGSEGRLGVITRVDLRVRPRPADRRVEAALLPDLGRGLEACRQLLRNRVPLTMLRLSDALETQVALAIGLAHSPFAALGRRYLALRGLGADACLMLLGSVGSNADNARVLSRARAIMRRQGGVSLGRGPGNHWLRDRFRHPYLRESLLDVGLATDTLETAASWAAAPRVRERVAAAIVGALEPEGERVAVLCHVSHPYPDGTSLYFTFFFRASPDPDATVARWARVKRAANRALVDAGATLSHHHGVGQWHAAAWPEEVGDHGRALVEAAAHCLDPNRILNPHVLLDPEDRLEA